MKNKLKKLLKFGVLIFGLSLILVNCQKEEVSEAHSVNKALEKESVFIEQVSISQIPEVINFLDKNPLASKSKSSKSSATKNDETDFCN